MTEDIQGLLEKINRDGVEKANAQAKAIIADAQAKADSIIRNAREEAARMTADAEASAKDRAARADETIRQAARDTVIKVGSSITSILERLLADEVNRSLANPDNLAKLVSDAIASTTGSGEVTVSADIVPALRAKLAASKSFTIVTDDSTGSGFSVRTDGGRIEHSFTGKAIADELAKHLRPDLAKLVRNDD